MKNGQHGKILGIAAAAGLAAVAFAFVYLWFNPPPGPGPGYDQVFKYCTGVYEAGADSLQSVQSDPLYAQIVKLPPGDYATGDGGGHIYLLGDGMFQIALPSQLQVVRNLGSGVAASSESDRPRSVIGCTDEQLVRALRTYGLHPEKLLSGADGQIAAVNPK